MSQFIIHEATDTDSNLEEEEEEEEEEANAHESNFTDDSTLFFDQAPFDYRQVNLQYPPFENVERSYEDAMVTTSEEENVTDFSNFVFGSEPSVAEYDEAKACEDRIQKFEKTLKQECEKSTDSFFNAVLWGAYFKLKGQNATNFDYEDLKVF